MGKAGTKPAGDASQQHALLSGRGAKTPLTVVVGGLDMIVAYGVLAILQTDDGIRATWCEPSDETLEHAISTQRPQAVVLGENVRYEHLMRIGAALHAPSIVIVSRFPGELLRSLCVGLGISCLGMDATHETVIEAVRLAAGRQPAPAREGLHRPTRSHPLDVKVLTGREREVLGYLSEGFTNPEIADVLHISVGTVRTHVGKILGKFDLGSRRDVIGMYRAPQR